MTDKEQIRAEIERLKSKLVRGACAAGIAMETNCKEEAYNEVLAFIDSLPAETASPELEKAAEEYARASMVIADAEKYKGFIDGAEWQKQQMAGQGVTIEAKFIKSRLRGHISLPVFFKDGEQFNNGEDVIVQVRKK
jgi:hypothetical protein